MLLVALLVTGVSSKDILCDKTESGPNLVHIKPGDTFSFSTPGKYYEGDMTCQAEYQLSNGCKEAQVRCERFLIKNDEEKCNDFGGSYLAVGRSMKRYCTKKKNKMLKFVNKNPSFLLTLVTREKTKGGITCTIACSLPKSDIHCDKSGNQSSTVLLKPGDNYFFSTPGKYYKGDMTCQAKYQLSDDCKEARVRCNRFLIKNSGKNCDGNGGAYLAVGRSMIRYCTKKKNDMLKFVNKNPSFLLTLVTDKTTRGGLTCTVACSLPKLDKKQGNYSGSQGGNNGGNNKGSKEGNITDNNTVPGNCVLSNWISWSACQKGLQFRSRYVVTEPKFGGTECEELIGSQICHEESPTVDCVESAWTEWSACPCREGNQTRTRIVSIPPQNGGSECGALEESQSCEGAPCVCEKPWTMFDGDGKCYLAFGDKFELDNAVHAVQCNQYNASHLISIDSEEKNKFLQALAPDSYTIWLGVKYDKESKTFSWLDGTPWKFTKWNTKNDEPNDVGGTYNCVVLDPEDGLWNMDECQETNEFICVKDPQ